ncbi:AMP-binding protein [Rhodospirillales bacterium]|nr:AMP-binding protein [Rhodospirillales bacterium]
MTPVSQIMTTDHCHKFYDAMVNRILTGTTRPFYVSGKDTKTYDEFHNALLKGINKLQSYHHGRVCLATSKSFETYSAIFSIVLGGHTWIPVNPNQPTDRFIDILKIGQVDVLIVDQPITAEMQEYCIEAKIAIISLDTLFSEKPSETLLGPDVRPTDIAIIYFTSGSTGKPKGVPITHENYILNVENILEILPINDNDVFGDYHDLSFVISIPVLFPCVFSGGALVPSKSSMDQLNPLPNILTNKVTVLITVPSTLSRIMKFTRDKELISVLRVLISCGEPLHLDVMSYFREKSEAEVIMNFYGSTEVAPWTFCHECKMDDVLGYADFGVAPIGKPIKGNIIKVSDDGELWVSSRQLSPGYLDGASPTTFITENNQRWYKTGDRVVEHDGVFVCKGRLDNQIKIGGYRIDLMDIEANLRQFDDVQNVFCFTVGGVKNPQIVATLFGGKAYSFVEIIDLLSKRLPVYMLPKYVEYFEEMPVNKNGKLDRVKVKEIVAERLQVR